MAQTVIDQNEILLNAVRYQIEGKVHPQSLSRFPGRIITGAPDYQNEQILSNWIINDDRGGLLVEEMDEATQANRYWWSTCINEWKNHKTLPRLATAITASDIGWVLPTVATAATWNTPNNALDGDAKTTATSNALGGTGWTDPIVLTTPSTATCTSVHFLAGRTGDITQIKVEAYYDAAYNTIKEGTYTDATLTAIAVGTKTVTALRISFYGTIGANGTLQYAEVYGAKTQSGTFGASANFNGVLYKARGADLLKLNTAGTAFTILRTFPATITDIVASLNSCLYIFQGDTGYYWYMSTTEVFTSTNQNQASKACQWDNKLFEMSTTGSCWYCATPNSETPTWTTAGNITDLPANAVKTLFVYFDSSGDDALYAATTKGLKVLDFANTKWIDTAIALGDHPNGGRGAIKWRDGAYISAGLNVQKYEAGSTARISDVGLDRDDGLPAEYNGEIVAFAGENNTKLFALVDSTQATGTCYSGIYAFNGQAWSCFWTAATTEGVMNSAIVSSASSRYALYFDHNAIMYYIVLERGNQNPFKISTFSYASGATHITSWFNGGSAVFPKTAVRVTLFVSGITATQKIFVRYRINKATTSTDSPSDFTLLGTIDNTTTGISSGKGQVEYEFASGVGVSFYTMQFRFVLESTSSTLTPDIEAVVLSYLVDLSGKMQWSFTVIGADNKKGINADQIASALATAKDSGVLVPFLFRENNTTETHYVRVSAFSAAVETGKDWRGSYHVSVVEP